MAEGESRGEAQNSVTVAELLARMKAQRSPVVARPSSSRPARLREGVPRSAVGPPLEGPVLLNESYEEYDDGEIASAADFAEAEELMAWPSYARSSYTRSSYRRSSVEDGATDVFPRITPERLTQDAEAEQFPVTAGIDIVDPLAGCDGEDSGAATVGPHARFSVGRAAFANVSPDREGEEPGAKPRVKPAVKKSSLGGLFQRWKAVATGDVSQEHLRGMGLVLQLAQVAITGVLGGLVFWLFGVLWGIPSLQVVTFFIAMVVQVALVVVVRVLRRGEGFWLVLLAMAVGVFVTVGPMVLLPS